MLNQTFTADNFRKIFDYENRKGNYIEGKFFPEVEQLSKDLKDIGSNFKELKSQRTDLSTDEYENKKNALNDKRTKLKEKKETLLTKELEGVSSIITSGALKIQLRPVKTPLGNPAFTADNNDASVYFAIKQLQFNISKLYKVKQSNRYNIICQLRSSLENKYPKYIIRTDISKFYESIPRDKLLKLINIEPLLTPSSKKIIYQILKEYTRVSGFADGMPRGIGVSAYLAELYLRRFDEWVLSDFEVCYYARYVDDIIIIYSPKPNSDQSKYLTGITNRIVDIGLSINPNKRDCK